MQLQRTLRVTEMKLQQRSRIETRLQRNVIAISQPRRQLANKMKPQMKMLLMKQYSTVTKQQRMQIVTEMNLKKTQIVTEMKPQRTSIVTEMKPPKMLLRRTKNVTLQ